MKKALRWAAALVLSACSAWYALTESFHFGILLVWCAAAAAVVYALFSGPINAFCGHGLGFVLKILFFLGCGLFAAVLAVILAGQLPARPKAAAPRAIVVLGCAVHGTAPSATLVCRLDTALAAWQETPAAVLVAAGGQGPREAVSEAAAMKAWLMAHGVPEEKILCEANSTSTEENFRFSALLLAERGVDVAGDEVLFVTNGFHCYRAAHYARDAGFQNAVGRAAALPLGQVLPCYMREVFAVLYYWVFKSPSNSILGRLSGLL